MVAQIPRPAVTITWEPLPPDYVLPDDPVENIQQPWLAAALTEALDRAGRITPEMLIASNFGLVATVNRNITVKAPDWFYVPQVQPVAPGEIRRSYTPGVEGDRVAVVMEFLSQGDNGELSLRATPPYGKLYFYEQVLQVPTYVTYNPYELILDVRCLTQGRYELQTPTPEGQFWIPELALYLGLWQGERQNQDIYWLRWWDGEGNLLLWGSEYQALERERANLEQQRAEEERQRADLQQQRAELLAAKLRELGIDPTTL